VILHMLGAGPAQVRAIQTARERGLTVAVSDQDPQAPGFKFADLKSYASTFDAESVRKDAAHWGSDFLMTTGTDQPVLTAARVSQNLGLPYFLTPEQALKVTNKRVMKNALARAGLPTVNYTFLKENFKENQLMDLSFPLVIKPLDSQGQRGVLKVQSPGEIRKWFPEVLRYSREDMILAEEYYPSTELTVSAWAEEGRAIILLITDRVAIDHGSHLGVCIAHRYPSLYHKSFSKLNRLVQGITEMIGIRQGPLYFQILAGEAGFQINEIACRLGGAYEDEFIPALTGVPLMKMMVDMTRGSSYPVPNQDRINQNLRGKVLSLQMFFYRPGLLVWQGGMKDLLRQPGILGGRFLLEPGTVITSRNNSTQRAGYFIVIGDSKEEVNRRVLSSYKKLKSHDSQGESLLVRDERMLFPL